MKKTNLLLENQIQLQNQNLRIFISSIDISKRTKPIIGPLNTVILIFILFPLSFLSAQDTDLSSYKSFFSTQLDNYQYWLDETTLNQYIQLDSSQMELLSINNEKLTLYLRIPNSNIWDSLNNDFLVQTGDSLKDELFEYYIHLMEVPRYQAFITIMGDDFLVKIYDDGGVTKTFISVTKDPIEHSFYANIDGSKFVGSTNIKTDKTSGGIKNKILTVLESDLRQDKYRTNPTNFKLFETNDNLLKYQALNLSKRIIPGNILGMGYYEKLDFHIIIEPHQNIQSQYLIKIRIQGKYGSGLFAPKSARYKPMSPKYDEHLRDYIKDFENEIRLSLK